MTTIRQAIGSRLAAWRKEEDLTPVEAASRLNGASGKSKWSRGTVNQAERGERAWEIDDLLALALAMGCTVADLLAVDETVKVGARDMTPEEVHRLTGSGPPQLEAGRAQLRDLLVVAQLRDGAETAYREIVGDLAVRVAREHRLATEIKEYAEEIARRHEADAQAAAIHDARREVAGPIEDLEAVKDRVERLQREYLNAVPAYGAAVDLMRLAKQHVKEGWR